MGQSCHFLAVRRPHQFLAPFFPLPCRWRAYLCVLGQHTGGLMLYAILCYNDEDAVWSWTKEEDDAVMGRLAVVRERLAPILGPSARLLPTTAATTLRKSPEPIVIDGPYAETKEQLLGFYVIDVENLDAALDVARQLTAANPGGAYEIRPIALYQPDKRVP